MERLSQKEGTPKKKTLISIVTTILLSELVSITLVSGGVFT
jgi:hypothetical protein